MSLSPIRPRSVAAGIAFARGFWHLGRFARADHPLYGEDVPAEKRSRRSRAEEEQEEHQQNQAHMRDRKDPPAATVDPIPLFKMTMTVAEADDEVAACRRAHEKEAEADNSIDEGEVGMKKV